MHACMRWHEIFPLEVLSSKGIEFHCILSEFLGEMLRETSRSIIGQTDLFILAKAVQLKKET